MTMESSHDPRDVLVRRKYFSLRPQPLEQWLWRQSITPSAERVFWLHWQEGMRNRDWCSSIPIRRVAALCALDISSVTRAYQALTKLGLVRRQDPGRDPARPFEQAVAITEVRLPRELLIELGRHPDRGAGHSATAAESATATMVVSRPDSVPVRTAEDPFKGLRARERQRALGDLLSRLSPHERRQYDEALRIHQPRLTFDDTSQLDPQQQGTLLQFLQIAAAKPLAATTAAAAAASTTHAYTQMTATAAGPRRLTVFELARLRRDLHAIAGMERGTQLQREVTWAVEQGALRRFTTLHAVRIALKKIREGAWTRPHRMPPNWCRELAQSEQCRSA